MKKPNLLDAILAVDENPDCLEEHIMAYYGFRTAWRIYPNDTIEISVRGKGSELIPLNIPASDFWQKIKNYTQK